MKTIQIAMAVQAALGALSEFVKDENVVHEFDLLSEAKKTGLISGIELLLSDTDATAETRHNTWMEQMLADGWVHGNKFSEEDKAHHRLVAFDALPKKEQAKEKMLHALVRALALVDSQTKIVTSAESAPTGGVPIKYIGKRDEHKDNLYGTNLEFAPGQTHHVSAAVAAKMLAHTDTYVHAGEIKPAQAVVAEAKQEEKLPVPLPNLDGMSQGELINFAQQHYGQHFTPDISPDDMRGRILSLIQARGR